MRELNKIFALWHREVLRMWREKSRMVSSLITPILWLLIFGSGMRNLQMGNAGNYQMFMFPGIVGMTLLFSSIMSGVSIIWDREFGFLKEILVAPVARSSIVLGKALGGGTNAFLQSIILLPLAFLIGVKLSFISILALIPLMILIAIGLVCVGLFIASLMKSMEGFQLIMNLVTMPLFFTSGALFPLNSVPEWLKFISYMNPVTYGIDAIRWVILGDTVTVFPIYTEIIILIVFATTMIVICSYTFGLRK